MPRARGFKLKDNPDYPHLSAWFDAMDARPAYQQVLKHDDDLIVHGKVDHHTNPVASHACHQVKSDDMTHHLVSEKIMQFSKPPHVSTVDDFTQRARRHDSLSLHLVVSSSWLVCCFAPLSVHAPDRVTTLAVMLKFTLLLSGKLQLS